MSLRSGSTERKGIVLASFLFINLILISNTVMVNNQDSFLRHVIGLVVSPLQILFQETLDDVSYQLERYVFLKNMYEEYYKIKKNYVRLEYDFQKAEKEHKRKSYWQNKLPPDKTFFFPVELISIDHHFPYNEIQINGGSFNGIELGMTVINSDGDLVGQVVEPLAPFAASVRLITSIKGGVGGYIEKNQLEGFLNGDGEAPGTCRFRYILESLPVEIGDLVVTSGTDQIFSAYIPIGTVVAVEKDYLVQKIYVKPHFTGKPLKHLLVVNRE